MAEKPVPDCLCAGYNPSCYGVDPNTPSGGGSYLDFPVGQGEQTIPSLIVQTNILLDGTPNDNYIEFPDGTRQYTAYIGEPGTVSSVVASFNFASQVPTTNSVYLNSNQYIGFPEGATRMTVQAASSGGGSYPFQLVTVSIGPPPVYAYDLYAVPCSGCGIQIPNVNIAGSTNTSYGLVNRVNTNLLDNVDRAAVFTGFATFNFSSYQITFTSTTTQTQAFALGQTYTLVTGIVGCPRSVVLTQFSSGTTWNVSWGGSNSNISNITTPVAVIGSSTASCVFSGTVKIQSGALTVLSTSSGNLANNNYGGNIVLVAANHWSAVVNGYPTPNSTPQMKFVGTSFAVDGDFVYGYILKNGNDISSGFYGTEGFTPLAYVYGSPYLGATQTPSTSYNITVYEEAQNYPYTIYTPSASVAGKTVDQFTSNFVPGSALQGLAFQSSGGSGSQNTASGGYFYQGTPPDAQMFSIGYGYFAALFITQ